MNIQNINNLDFDTLHDFVYAFWSCKVFQHPIVQKKLKKPKPNNRRHREIDADEFCTMLGSTLISAYSDSNHGYSSIQLTINNDDIVLITEDYISNQILQKIVKL
jgi:hypothetical protein